MEKGVWRRVSWFWGLGIPCSCGHHRVVQSGKKWVGTKVLSVGMQPSTPSPGDPEGWDLTRKITQQWSVAAERCFFFWGKELWDWVWENFNLSPKKFQQGPMAGWWSGQSNWEVYFFNQGWQLTSGKTLQGRSSFCLCEGKIWAWILSLEFKCEIPKAVEESLWQLVTNWGR